MEKEQIEMRIKEIGTLVLDSQKEQSNYIGELASLNGELANMNAPSMTESQADDLLGLLTDTINDLRMNVEDMDFEFEVSYDNRIEVSNFDLSNAKDSMVESLGDVIAEFFSIKMKDE
jgi:hypothetical protein|tara:strand:+ start:89 stop:442 length:354 start_codon:yes stop_codon:yes gene_type:complete